MICETVAAMVGDVDGEGCTVDDDPWTVVNSLLSTVGSHDDGMGTMGDDMVDTRLAWSDGWWC